jgi:ParB family chromosome partitioning protein
MMALGVTDDTERQKAAWLAIPESHRTPEVLRQVLTETEIASSSPVAKFVGMDVYRAAGGPVSSDLFSDVEGAVFLGDAVLLQQLAQQKLNAAAEALRSEAGAWIEVSPRLDLADLAAYQRVRSIRREPTPEEQERISQLSTEIDALETRLYDQDDEEDDEDLGDDLDGDAGVSGEEDADAEAGRPAATEDESALDEAEYRKLQDRMDLLREEEEALRNALRVPDPAQAAVAGTLLSIGREGELKVHRGLLKPDDAKRLANEEKRAAKAVRQKTPGSIPAWLVMRLSAHRTQALQAILTNNTKVALAALCQRLVLAAFFDVHSETATALRVEIGEAKLNAFADDLAGSNASRTLQAHREEWRKRIPEDSSEVLPWLLEQSDSTIAELLAFCTSMSLDGIQSQEGVSRVDELARAVSLDMSDWWAPTADSYLGKIKKGQILEIVKAVVSQEEAARLEKMKKPEMAKAAERLLKGTRWLPAFYKQDAAA